MSEGERGVLSFWMVLYHVHQYLLLAFRKQQASMRANKIMATIHMIFLFVLRRSATSTSCSIFLAS